jgi:thymidylate synthase
MTKADHYFKNTIETILSDGYEAKDPRTKWMDGEPAHYKSIKGAQYQYNIAKGEFPVHSYRHTAIKGAFHDIEAIYIKQTSIIEEMHPSIKPWWQPFALENFSSEGKTSIGYTYGYIVRKYALMDKVLQRLETNPSCRRVILSLWQQECFDRCPDAIKPCAYETHWSIREFEDINYLDVILNQRSQDYLVTASINPAQYTMLAMMVANHLTWKTGKLHKVGLFIHNVYDVHLYDRHINIAKDLISRPPAGVQPIIELNCEPKSFYAHTYADFNKKYFDLVPKLGNKLEFAV